MNADKRSINLGLGGQKWPWVKSLKCDRMKIWHLEKQQPAWRKSKFPRLLVQTIHLPVDSTVPETSKIRANIKQQESSSNMSAWLQVSCRGLHQNCLFFFFFGSIRSQLQGVGFVALQILVPWTETELTSPALQGRPTTTGPPSPHNYL